MHRAYLILDLDVDGPHCIVDRTFIASDRAACLAHRRGHVLLDVAAVAARTLEGAYERMLDKLDQPHLAWAKPMLVKSSVRAGDTVSTSESPPAPFRARI